MDKAQKTIELLVLLKMSSFVSASKIGADERTYEDNGSFFRFHDVSADKVFYGFVPIKIPNPADEFDTQLENLMDIYTSEQIVKGCLKSIVIEQQSAARKAATGEGLKMFDAEFATAFDKLGAEQPEIISRLKTYEHIKNHIIEEWLKNQSTDTEGLRLF